MSNKNSSENNNQEMLTHFCVEGNSEIKNIIQQTIKKYVGIEINLSVNIPNNSSNVKVPEPIMEAYESTVPNGWFDWRQKPKDFNELINQLSEMPHKNIMKFITHLSNYNRVPKNNGERTYTRPLHSYLLIQLRPEGTGRLLVKAWFIPDDTVQEPLERFKLLKVDEQQTEIPYVPEEMPTLLSNLLQQCFEEHLQGQTTELTVEVFLPRERLCDEIEKWEYIIDDRNIDDENRNRPIGFYYQVNVRSYERLKIKSAVIKDHWKKNWLRVQQLWQAIPHDEEVFMLAQARSDSTTLEYLLVEKIALKVGCTLSKSERNGLFDAIHNAGTPIVLLLRSDVLLPNNTTELDNLIAGGPLHELSVRVKKQRQAAKCHAVVNCNEMHLGNHLVLLWDDPNRVPPNYKLEF